MPLTGKELLKLAEKNGWKEVRINGSHHIMEKSGFEPVSIPVHGNKDLKKRHGAKTFKRVRLKKIAFPFIQEDER